MKRRITLGLALWGAEKCHANVKVTRQRPPNAESGVVTKFPFIRPFIGTKSHPWDYI